MLVALLVAVIVAILVKIVLGLFDATARYADAIAILVGILVFVSRSGLI